MNFKLTPSEAPPPPHFNVVKIMNFKLTPSEAPPPPISMLDSEIFLAQRRKGIILQH